MPRRANGGKNSGPKGSSNGQSNGNGILKKSAVQMLYDLCVETFSPPGTLPTTDAVEKLRSYLDTIKPSDMGLKEVASVQDVSSTPAGRPTMRKGKGRRPVNKGAEFAPPITYLHVYECDSFSIGIFCLPTSGVLPLHNHPGMTVLSKILYGSMHIRSYDCIELPQDIQHISGPPQSILARKKVNTVYSSPCEPSILCPRTGGNIHSFTAVTPCAVLDVLAPPYSEKDGRHCTYYRDYPCSRPPGLPEKNGSTCEDEQSYVWLEEIERPDDFFVKGGQYMGPRIEL